MPIICQKSMKMFPEGTPDHCVWLAAWFCNALSMKDDLDDALRDVATQHLDAHGSQNGSGGHFQQHLQNKSVKPSSDCELLNDFVARGCKQSGIPVEG